jgi:sec-independent protein translocase protein TatA
MFGLGLQELIIILVIALIFFGPSRLPQMGSGLGKAIRDFRKGVAGEKEDTEEGSAPMKDDSGNSPSRDTKQE